MLVYNITTRVDKSIENDWLEWQNNVNIPAMIATDLFITFKFFQLIDPVDNDAATYIIQYYIDDMLKYEMYLNSFAEMFLKNAFSKWGDKFIAFKTLMQGVQ